MEAPIAERKSHCLLLPPLEITQEVLPLPQVAVATDALLEVDNEITAVCRENA